MTDTFEIPEVLRGFGKPLQVHPPKTGTGRTGYFTIAAVLAILSALTGIGVVNPPAHNAPPPVVFTSLTIVFGILALTCLAIGLFDQNYTLILFPDGLARTGVGQPEIFRWSDISEIYEEVAPVAWKQRIVTRDGRALKIDASVSDGRELGQALQQTMFDRMLPDALKAFDGGETLNFGPLRLDQSCLYYKNKRLRWDEIAKMQLMYNAYTRSIQFEVTTEPAFLPWCVVRTEDIPNLNVFKTVVDRKRAFTR